MRSWPVVVAGWRLVATGLLVVAAVVGPAGVGPRLLFANAGVGGASCESERGLVAGSAAHADDECDGEPHEDGGRDDCLDCGCCARVAAAVVAVLNRKPVRAFGPVVLAVVDDPPLGTDSGVFRPPRC